MKWDRESHALHIPLPHVPIPRYTVDLEGQSSFCPLCDMGIRIFSLFARSDHDTTETFDIRIRLLIKNAETHFAGP